MRSKFDFSPAISPAQRRKTTGLYHVNRVFRELGGWRAMAAWARENPREFYRLWASMQPKELALSGELDINASYQHVTHLIIEPVDVAQYKLEKQRYLDAMQPNNGLSELLGDISDAEYIET